MVYYCSINNHESEDSCTLQIQSEKRGKAFYNELEGLSKQTYDSRKTRGWFFASFIPVRTGSLHHGLDLLMPTTHRLWVVSGIAKKVFLTIFTLSWDAITLPFRLITFVPRCAYNAYQRRCSKVYSYLFNKTANVRERTAQWGMQQEAMMKMLNSLLAEDQIIFKVFPKKNSPAQFERTYNLVEMPDFLTMRYGYRKADLYKLKPCIQAEYLTEDANGPKVVQGLKNYFLRMYKTEDGNVTVENVTEYDSRFLGKFPECDLISFKVSLWDVEKDVLVEKSYCISKETFIQNNKKITFPQNVSLLLSEYADDNSLLFNVKKCLDKKTISPGSSGSWAHMKTQLRSLNNA